MWMWLLVVVFEGFFVFFFFLYGGSFLWLVVGLVVEVVGLLRLVMGLVEINVGGDGVVVAWWW